MQAKRLTLWWLGHRDVTPDERQLLEQVVHRRLRLVHRPLVRQDRFALMDFLRHHGYPLCLVEYELNQCAAAVSSRRNTFISIERFSPNHHRSGTMKVIRLYHDGRIQDLYRHADWAVDSPLNGLSPTIDNPQLELFP